MSLQYDEEFAIVRSGEAQYGLWPARHPLPSGYSFTGPVGTREQMEALLHQQFVETAPAYYPSSRFNETNWGP